MTVSNTPGAPCWIELTTPDADAAAKFYGDLFGWTCTDPVEDFGGYRNFEHKGAPMAGLMQSDGSFGHSSWTVYLETDDAARTVEKARAHGGTVVVEPIQVAELGSMAYVVDPAGAGVGVWQPGTHQGFAVRAEPGAPAWFETLSKDYDKSVAFYRDVFDWVPETMSDTPEFRYTTLGKGAAAMAGIMDATGFLGSSPSRWQFYVAVEDTDAIVEQTVAAGGKLAQPVDDTPYGRLGALVDPAGVAFCVMGPNQG
jgi:predicted enzyme related to lactoylglutathione lyase